ncbi:hypothetical protein LX32DRAFT_20509 [Colletotrichum zoysiae]|uniref:Uncharacterized protein n=1 Tax=Colletotrichum zoysiae TaxID=1216348 RepID=A0AAD9LZB2_9PEZI|nr:hypothetical protein LX32DRAFT_20509 [Colletotrichum zoysiae]
MYMLAHNSSSVHYFVQPTMYSIVSGNPALVEPRCTRPSNLQPRGGACGPLWAHVLGTRRRRLASMADPYRISDKILDVSSHSIQSLHPVTCPSIVSLSLSLCAKHHPRWPRVESNRVESSRVDPMGRTHVSTTYLRSGSYRTVCIVPIITPRHPPEATDIDHP